VRCAAGGGAPPNAPSADHEMSTLTSAAFLAKRPAGKDVRLTFLPASKERSAVKRSSTPSGSLNTPFCRAIKYVVAAGQAEQSSTPSGTVHAEQTTFCVGGLGVSAWRGLRPAARAARNRLD